MRGARTPALSPGQPPLLGGQGGGVGEGAEEEIHGRVRGKAGGRRLHFWAQRPAGLQGS